MKQLKKNCIFTFNTIIDALKAMKTNSSKCLVVLDKNSKFKGTLSDGDIRRAILQNTSLTSEITKIYNKKPFYVEEKEKKKLNLINIFKNNKYEIIPIVDHDKHIVEIIHWSEVIFDTQEQIDSGNVYAPS